MAACAALDEHETGFNDVDSALLEAFVDGELNLHTFDLQNGNCAPSNSAPNNAPKGMRTLAPAPHRSSSHPYGNSPAKSRMAKASAEEPPAPVPLREQDRLLPMANVARLMADELPRNAKISKEAKVLMQEMVSELICFITSEANDCSLADGRKAISQHDILEAMCELDLGGFAPAMEAAMVSGHLGACSAAAPPASHRGDRSANGNGNGSLNRSQSGGAAVQGEGRHPSMAYRDASFASSTSASREGSFSSQHTSFTSSHGAAMSTSMAASMAYQGMLPSSVVGQPPVGGPSRSDSSRPFSSSSSNRTSPEGSPTLGAESPPDSDSLRSTSQRSISPLDKDFLTSHPTGGAMAHPVGGPLQANVHQVLSRAGSITHPSGFAPTVSTSDAALTQGYHPSQPQGLPQGPPPAQGAMLGADALSQDRVIAAASAMLEARAAAQNKKAVVLATAVRPT